jgi:osmotically-inducible protein OsmY
MRICQYLFPQNRKILNRILSLIIVILLNTVSVTVTAGLEEIKDIEITLAIERKLQNDKGVPAHLIDVQTRHGIVTLSGLVENLLARDRAAELATTLKGVRSVINLIEVIGVVRRDDQIRSDVNLALLEDPATDLFDVNVDVREGTVILSGKVDSWQEKQLCVLVAKGVIGVKAVESRIEVSQKSRRPDDEIKADIEQRLAYDVWINNALINLKVVRGNVFLSGIVGSLAEKERAAASAWVAGVTSVNDSDLAVDWFKLDKVHRNAEYDHTKTDDEVKQAVKEAFFYDPRLSRFDISVSVDHGVVTLAGNVPNLKARQVAEQDARNTFGVWSVSNYIKVRPDMGPHTRPSRDLDAELARKVRLALLRNPYTHQHKIGVTVNRQLVMLDGTVHSKLEKTKAADVASTVKGVVDVINNLRVMQNWTPIDDWEIKQNIEKELWWSPFVDETDLSVTVADGTATLVGVVDTLRERRAATENAFEGGARRVRNHLKVRHGPEALRP